MGRLRLLNRNLFCVLNEKTLYILVGILRSQRPNPQTLTENRGCERAGSRRGAARHPPRADPARRGYLARRGPKAGCGRRILRRSRQSRGRAASHAAPSPSRMAPLRAQLGGRPAPPRPGPFMAATPQPPPRGGASRRLAQPVFRPGPEARAGVAGASVLGSPAVAPGALHPPGVRREVGLLLDATGLSSGQEPGHARPASGWFIPHETVYVIVTIPTIWRFMV